MSYPRSTNKRKLHICIPPPNFIGKMHKIEYKAVVINNDFVALDFSKSMILNMSASNVFHFHAKFRSIF
jgi:hypothetical protein